MKILLISSLFPPDAKGGAELSAYNAAAWFRSQGIEVGILTTSANPGEQTCDTVVNGFRTWKLSLPRPYQIQHFESQTNWKKAVWHIQDHLDPRNSSVIEGVLDTFKPDAIHIHLLTGFGYNAITVLKKARVPVLYFLHDLGLGCLRANMYKGGSNCETPCPECKLSARYKSSLLSDADTFNFISPSQDNLETLKLLINLPPSRCNVVANIDLENPKPRKHSSPDVLKLVYVGRLHETKGVDFLLDVMNEQQLADKRLKLTVVGGGPLEQHLRRRAAGDERIEIIGRVSPDIVKDYVSYADILCVPSLWRENHPGVIREALRAGVPVLVSDIGGAPEMVKNNVDGLILPPGDKLAWASALAGLSASPSRVEELQNGAVETGRSYSVDKLGRELISIQTAAASQSAFRPL